MRNRSKKKKVTRRKRPVCGLCGSKTNLTKTDCCGQWICDDADQYAPFSYATNSCYRNHDHYTLCALHYHEGHEGDWKTCPDCKKSFSHELEMYVYFGTNEYNFEKLPDPPSFEPTLCSQCGKRIHLGTDGYSVHKDQYTCSACSDPLPKSVTDISSEFSDFKNAFMDFDDDDDGELDDWGDPADRPQRLGPDDLDQIPPALTDRFKLTGNMIKDFCDEHNAIEFGFICLDMLISLCVQFPDKIRRGQPKSWAAGIVHAIGMVNFLSDPETTPFIEPFEIYTGFDVSESTMQSKSRTIRDWFGIFQMDPMWQLPELIMDNPMMWMIPLDGVFIDLRQAPETVQRRAVEEGLIPMTPNEFKQNIIETRQTIEKITKQPLTPPEPPADAERPNIKFADHLSDNRLPESLPLFDQSERD